MLRSTHISTSRSLRLAGILAAAALVAPAAAHAQTDDGERALLNHITAPASAVTAIAVRPATESSGFYGSVSGERALAVRIPTAPVAPGAFDRVFTQPFAVPPIDGGRALLGVVRVGR
jgi:hypothetical protein